MTKVGGGEDGGSGNDVVVQFQHSMPCNNCYSCVICNVMHKIEYPNMPKSIKMYHFMSILENVSSIQLSTIQAQVKFTVWVL